MTLTMDPIDICAPRQSPVVIPFVHQVRAPNFELSRDELSQISLTIQLYASISTGVYLYTLITCSICSLIAPGQRTAPKTGICLTRCTQMRFTLPFPNSVLKVKVK